MVVLYVDDDADDIQLFGEALKEVDPTIIFMSANCGEDALNFLYGNVLPDYIFLDINMPLMNGIECLLKIRSNPKLTDLSVVMLSTSQNHADIERSTTLGADFISKPNSYANLVTELSTRLKVLK